MLVVGVLSVLTPSNPLWSVEMSADNGIYILETAGPEFRVAYSQAIDNIYGNFDDTTANWAGDMDRMMDVFGNSEVFTDLNDALDKAEKMVYDYKYLEDGICVVPNFRHLKFGQL
jgi:hypothetical protein